MKCQVYKRADGKEEIRFKPESEQDCYEIEDCSHCFFENDHVFENDQAGDCIDEPDFDNFMERFGFKPNNSSIILSKEPGMSHPTRDLTFEEMLEKSGFLRSLSELNVNQRQPQINITEVRTFIIKDGKVIADPETRELMRKAGILEKIENSFEEEDEN